MYYPTEKNYKQRYHWCSVFHNKWQERKNKGLNLICSLGLIPSNCLSQNFVVNFCLYVLNLNFAQIILFLKTDHFKGYTGQQDRLVKIFFIWPRDQSIMKEQLLFFLIHTFYFSSSECFNWHCQTYSVIKQKNKIYNWSPLHRANIYFIKITLLTCEG